MAQFKVTLKEIHERVIYVNASCESDAIQEAIEGGKHGESCDFLEVCEKGHKAEYVERES